MYDRSLLRTGFGVRARAYILRHKVSRNRRTASWSFAGSEDWLRRVQPHALVEHSGQVRQGVQHHVEGDVLFGRALRLQLCPHSGKDCVVFREVVDATRHGRSRCLGARHDQQSGIWVYFASGHLFLAAGVLQNCAEEVATVGRRLKPLVDLGYGKLLMIAQFLEQCIRQELLEDQIQPWKLLYCPHDWDCLHGIKDKWYPRMVVTRFETAKRLTKSEVADDIECSPIKPLGHVDSAFGRVLVQTSHKNIDVLANEWFLLSDLFVGESMRENTAQAGVILFICCQDLLRAVDTKIFGVAQLVLTKLKLTRLSCVDIQPGFWIDEWQARRCDSNNISVLLVQRS